MSDSLKESIKNIFVLIGIGSILYWITPLYPSYYNKEKYQSACADEFGKFEFKWVNDNLYCKVSEEKWQKHPLPPVPTKYNVWGQEIE